MFSLTEYLYKLHFRTDFFLSVNRTPEISAALLWKSLKAFIRGEIISYAHYEKKYEMRNCLNSGSKFHSLTVCMQHLVP